MNYDFLFSILPNFKEDDFRAKIKIYKSILRQFNAVHNLSHIKNIDENILDSISILKYFDLSRAQNISDIGSGAGFPAIFLALIMQNSFCLFEPNPKKAAFLRMIKIECNLNNINIYKQRVQNHKPLIKSEIITSRALMHMQALIKLCSNIRDRESVFIFWKGSQISKELKNLNNYQIFKDGLRNYCILKVV